MSPYNYSNPQYGGLRIGPGTISPYIKYLIIANGAIYFIQLVVGGKFTALFGLFPMRIFSDFPNNMYMIFQCFTYMFLHAGFFHILFNMFVLWMFGTEIEYSWGSKAFLKFYVYCGLGGAFLSLIFNYNTPVVIVGASGAIYGILVAYWLMFPNRILYVFFILPMRVKWAIPFFGVLNFLAAGPNVAHLAHLGGALVGLIYLKLDWRLASFARRLKSVKIKRKEAKLEKRRQKAEEIMKRVDKILDKINEVGIENISREDRQFLEDASQLLSNDDKKI